MPEDRGKSSQDELVQRILQQILGSDRLKGSTAFSHRTYSDEPILRTGADLQREQATHSREEGRQRREEARRRDRAQRERRHKPDADTSPSRADVALYLTLLEQDEDVDLRDDDFLGAGPTWGAPPRDTAHARKREPLPETLRRLRSLEHETNGDGAHLRGAELFVRQARIAADYTDGFSLPFGPQYRYYPSYQQLSNDELRGYFAWRTKWRAHETQRMPFTYVRLLAAELVNGIGAEPGEACLTELRRLDASCVGQADGDLGPDIHADLRTWIRDYVVYFGLDPTFAATDEERAFAQAVATLRLAERDVLARKGIHGLTAQDAPAKPPSDEEVWQAFGAISKYAVERSPFFRKYPKESAAVGAAIFRRMAEHCAKRRKTLFVDGVVGEEQSWFYTPFLGLPFLEEHEHADVTVRVTACETISHRFGRWRIKRGFERRTRDKKLGQLLKAVDRQMRLDWGFGHPLKAQTLPKYLQKMVAEESAAEHERREEAERRKIKIDLSQLRHIRAAAATTREALLVDEERDEEPATDASRPMASATQPTVPAAPIPQPQQVVATPAAQQLPKAEGPAAMTPSPTEEGGPMAPNALGLTDLELQALHRLLDGQGIDDLLGPGAPMASVLVDSINEKLFDEVCDAVVEFGDDGAPRMVEDYAEDVRDLLAG